MVGDLAAVYLDGPAGTQVSEAVVDAVARGLVSSASNVGGSFVASRNSEAVVSGARSAAADLLNGDPSEVVFGPNMTTLTFSFSRAVSDTWASGDNIVLTRLDHDANVTPWARAAGERSVEVRFADIVEDDVSLDVDHLESLLDTRTRLVAIPGASNAFGSTVDVARVAAAAHEVGALCFVDAVHLAPHARIDVTALGCDALVCSAYKFFGPHVGVLWAHQGLLQSLDAYKVRPAPSDPPGKFETGTPSFALLSGFTAAVDYLAGLGSGPDRRSCLDDAFTQVGAHERALGEQLLAGLPPEVRLWGRPTMDGRVPTFAVEKKGRTPQQIADRLGARGVFVWAGHYYAVEPMSRLGLLDRGGLVRIGLVHINTCEEVDRLLDELAAA